MRGGQKREPSSVLRQALSEELQPKCRLEPQRHVRVHTSGVIQVDIGAEFLIAMISTPAFNGLDERSADA